MFDELEEQIILPKTQPVSLKHQATRLPGLLDGRFTPLRQQCT